MKFKYAGVDKEGGPVSGEMDSESPEQVQDILGRQGIQVTSLKQIRKSLFGSRKISPDDIASFCEQLARLVDSDMPLPEAIAALAKDAHNENFQNSLLRISGGLEQGRSLEESFEREKELFPEILPVLVLAGEKCGNLSETLRLAAQHSWRTHHFREKLKGTLAYPLFILIILFSVTMWILIEVIPEYKNMLLEMDIDCDSTIFSAIIFQASEAPFNFAAFIFGIVFFVFFINYLSSKVYCLGEIKRYVFFRIPLYKKLLKAIYLAQFCRTLSLFIKSGIELSHSLRLLCKLNSNIIPSGNIEVIADAVECGEPLSSAMRMQSNIYPELLVFMISSAEKTGRMYETLQEAAEINELQVEAESEFLYSITPPFIMIFVGGIAIYLITEIMTPLMYVMQYL